MTGLVTPVRPSARLVPPPVPSSPHRSRRWRWWWPAVVVMTGCLIVCHGCHRGGHDSDDELSVIVDPDNH